MSTKTIVHLNPIWRYKSDFIIGARHSDSLSNNIGVEEQFWSRKIGDNTFEICCIPFFVYNISLGDIVKTDSDYWITEVLVRSGHFTFRIWLGDTRDQFTRDQVIQEIIKLGCLFEWYSENLLAIDVPTRILAEQISAYLLKSEQLGLLTYETGQM
jgi:hypothetical protein